MMRTPRFNAVAACLAAMTLMAAAGCGSEDNGSSGSGGEASGGEFKIGAGLALTGSFAGFDKPALEGMRIAIDEINEQGGMLGEHKISLDVQDVRSDPGQAVVATKNLMQDDPNVLIVACMTDAAIPQGQIAQKAQVPAFSTCATSTTLTTSVGDYMFGNFPPDTYESTAAAQYAVDQGYKTAFVVSSPESSYTTNAPKAFGLAFEEGGGEVVGEATFTFNQQEFSPIVTKIKNTSPAPDVIETGMFEPAFPAFMKQLKAAGVDIPVIGTAGIDTPSVVAAGKDVEGVVLPSVGLESESPDLKAFNDKLRAAAGDEAVTSYATRGYDLIKIIEAAVENADSTDPTAIRDAVIKLEDVQGLSTTTTYAYEGGNGLPLIQPTYMVKIEGGDRKLVEEIELDPDSVPKLEE